MRENAFDEALPEAPPPAPVGREAVLDGGLVRGGTRITIHHESASDFGSREIYVSIDGEQVAALRPNETFTVDVRPGTHRVRAHNTLFSKTHDLVLRPGDHARFVAVNRAGFGTLGFMILLGASPLYLTFERDK
jgi:hypothetical protein